MQPGFLSTMKLNEGTSFTKGMNGITLFVVTDVEFPRGKKDEFRAEISVSK